MFSDRKFLWWRVKKMLPFWWALGIHILYRKTVEQTLISCFWNNGFMAFCSEIWKKWHCGVTNLTLMVNGTMDWVSLCEDIWSQQRKLWAPDESVLYWWISGLIGHEVVSKRDGVNQRVDHQDVLCASSGQQDGVISALPLLTHGTLRTQGAPKVLMIYSNTNIKMSWQRIWICTCCYS